jgi:hypothetical protein
VEHSGSITVHVSLRNCSILDRNLWRCFAIAIVLFGGSAIQAQDSESPWTLPAQLPPDQQPQYFPTRIFGSNRAWTAKWYSWILRSMGEAPLSESGALASNEVYRLLVLPSFRPPFVVRLTFTPDGTGELVTKLGRTDGCGQPSVKSNTREVPHREIDLFVQKLRDANYWSIPSQEVVDPDPRKRSVVMDGTDWVLEGAKGGKYHLVARSSLDPREFADLLDMLMRTIGKLDERSIPIEPRSP